MRFIIKAYIPVKRLQQERMTSGGLYLHLASSVVSGLCTQQDNTLPYNTGSYTVSLEVKGASFSCS